MCKLLRLPAETLSAICEYLAHSHPRSVLSLALANKHCYCVASAFLYRTIAFKAHCPEQLAQDAQRCEHLLRRDSAFRHVNRFIVHGRFQVTHNPVRGGCGEDCRGEVNHVNQHPLEWQRMPCVKLVGSLYDDEQTLGDLAPIPHHRRTSYQRIYPSDTCWRPLCRLVETLPALKDFMFACPNQFPPCLLETLHKHLASPRLHICVFALHSLADAELDPHDVALAGSPLLHRLWVRYDDTNGYNVRGIPNYHADAVMDMVTGVAPNLKEVRVLHDYGDDEDEDGNLLPSPVAWKGFPSMGEEGQQMLGSLRFLELDGKNWLDDPPRRLLSKDDMRRWGKCTDFSVLNALKLRQLVTREALAFLVERCSFPHLISLALCYDDTSTPEGVQLLHAFLCSLPNLRSLELSSPARKLGAAAFNQALTRLRLPDGPGTAYHEDLPFIVQRCPLIEDLSVTLPRYRGGAPEVRLYRAIGSLPRLRRLELMLDASSTTPETRVFVPQHAVQPGDVDIDATCLGGYLRGVPWRAVYNALIDSAVDEKLALAIFRAVSHGKNHAKSSGSMAAVQPLETLHIRVKGGDRIVWSWANASTMSRPRHVLQPYLSNLARSWRVDRDPRDDRRDVLHAVEVGRKKRLGSDEMHQRSWEKGTHIALIFRRIWPEKAEGSHWFDDWESWPLDKLGDEEEE
jgi:hypothetical protein